MCISAVRDSAKSASALSEAALRRHQRVGDSAKFYLQKQHEVGISAVSDSPDANLVLSLTALIHMSQR